MRVLDKVRVVEVADFSFVPCAGALLADWGADVVKIEHPERGDAQRSFITFNDTALDPDCNPIVEHANRGKRSVGIDLSGSEGQRLLYRICQTADVFLTNYQPETRRQLGIDVDHIRAANPAIIYARGSAYGDSGPDRDRSGFDASAYWSHGGIARSLTPDAFEFPLSLGIPAFGDLQGAMYLAGGIAAALFGRLSTGKASEVDVSLLSTAWWGASMGLGIGMNSGLFSQVGMPQVGGIPNPLWGNFRTSDGAVIALMVLQPDRHLRDVFAHLGLDGMADDPRFASTGALIANAGEANRRIAAAIAARPLEHWRARFQTMQAQWATVQSLADLASDEQALATDMVFEVAPLDDERRIRLTRGPVQFDHQPISPTRAPKAWEHTEIFLLELGLEWDEIARLKEVGAIT
jgi:crotonobetainyl-CoA:carnitine CoA-transferase CaiB-like acyl-CoA transferase